MIFSNCWNALPSDENQALQVHTPTSCKMALCVKRWENHKRTIGKLSIYPLVMTNIVMENGPCTLDFPMNNDFP